MISSLVVVPVVLQPIIRSAIITRDQDGFITTTSVAKGHRHLNALAQKWTRADRIDFGQNVGGLWTVKSPGVFRDGIVLIIGLPADVSPTPFHPNAYLPSYINGPVDADASYYYPYKAEPGLPRMSVVGNIPLYMGEKRAFKV
ncbi:hypothetical protein MPER_11318 [Moniliophthora perniciosa FA553]|nr:hypothetical protein MPER_11318 [Moniliophthora perniciosa FA553]